MRVRKEHAPEGYTLVNTFWRKSGEKKVQQKDNLMNYIESEYIEYKTKPSKRGLFLIILLFWLKIKFFMKFVIQILR